MKSYAISTASILLISLMSAIPALAQSERINCLRDRDVINCPGYGSFNYRSNNNNSNVNQSSNNSRLEGEIDNIYLQVLGHNGDAYSLRNYRQSMNNQGWSLAQVRSDLARSPAFAQTMNRIYQEFLGRNADTTGLQSYRTLVINGKNISDVRTEIANSSEAKNRNNHEGNFYQQRNFYQRRNFYQPDSNNRFEGTMNDILCQEIDVCF